MKSISAIRLYFPFVLFLVLLAAGAARAQGPNISQACELHGLVEQANGAPFGDGVLVKIEFAKGGMAAQIVTDSRGRFDVGLPQRARYIVTVHVSGFRDASSEVDLESTSRASIRLTLHAVSRPSESHSSEIVSADELNLPEAARTEAEKGRSLLIDKNKPANSVKPLSKAIQIAPAYAQAHLLLGTAFMDLGKWSEAESELNKAASFNDKLDSAYLALGACLIEEKKFAEAEKPLLRGLELLPGASQGHYDLGRTYFALNRFPEAKAEADKAISLQPEFPEAHLLLGNVLLRLRDGPDALAEFQEYLRLAPNGAFAGPAKELVKKLQAGLGAAH